MAERLIKHAKKGGVKDFKKKVMAEFDKFAQGHYENLAGQENCVEEAIRLAKQDMMNLYPESDDGVEAAGPKSKRPRVSAEEPLPNPDQGDSSGSGTKLSVEAEKEMLLKKIESSDQPTGIAELNQESEKAPSKK